MGYRLSKITTKTGDDGLTQVDAGSRMSKNHPRIHALGDIDELNSLLGVLLTMPISHSEICTILTQIQQDLFDLGGELCPPFRTAITQVTILRLEENISQWNKTLPPLIEFILPGGNVTSAHCHLARTVCRRAERTLVALHEVEPLSLNLLKYMNRLSDLLFVIARIFTRDTSCKEIVWKHSRKK